jgi:hypothetical protein
VEIAIEFQQKGVMMEMILMDSAVKVTALQLYLDGLAQVEMLPRLIHVLPHVAME